jgi:glycosyltransferase involved in cell wall biosynthesis
MRLKIIEAMAAGLPVVATTISAEGIELFEPNGLFRYDDPEKMAEGIVKLLRDRPASRELGVCAQQAVAAKYTWAASVGIMLRAFVTLKSGAE